MSCEVMLRQAQHDKIVSSVPYGLPWVFCGRQTPSSAPLLSLGFEAFISWRAAPSSVPPLVTLSPFLFHPELVEGSSFFGAPGLALDLQDGQAGRPAAAGAAHKTRP
jgi:hypothetical protein